MGATAGIIQIPIARNAEELPESVALESVTPSFAADPSIVGQTIRIASPPRPVPIVGVLPADFQPLGETDIWEVIDIGGAAGARTTRILRVLR